MTTVREVQLDELEALVIAVIRETRGLRLDSGTGWPSQLRRLEALVHALRLQLDEMKESARARWLSLELDECQPVERR